MTKEQFLKDFKDINSMYNNCMMLDSLENHINDLLETELEKLEENIIRNSRPYREKLVIDVYTCQMLIRKEIEELKGEQK